MQSFQNYISFSFPDDVELGKHMRITHLNAYAKICDICGVSMKGRDALERHQAEHAGVSRKLLKCDLCDTTLTTKHGLVRHMKTRHTEEYQTPQVCPMCSKVSPSLQAHRNHIWYMHSLQRKHVCKLCDKAFKRLTDFKVSLCIYFIDQIVNFIIFHISNCRSIWPPIPEKICIPVVFVHKPSNLMPICILIEGRNTLRSGPNSARRRKA